MLAPPVDDPLVPTAVTPTDLTSAPPTPLLIFFADALVVELGRCNAMPPLVTDALARRFDLALVVEVEVEVDVVDAVAVEVMVLLRSFFLAPPLRVPPTAPNFFMGDRVGASGTAFILGIDDQRY